MDKNMKPRTCRHCDKIIGPRNTTGLCPRHKNRQWRGVPPEPVPRVGKINLSIRLTPETFQFLEESAETPYLAACQILEDAAKKAARKKQK